MIKERDRAPLTFVLLGEVERVLSEHGVCRRGDDVLLVACSGGIDSVVLADAAVELFGARRVVLGHVDHRVRSDSSEDAAFVERFARALGSESRILSLDPGEPSEARLRTLRYEALERERAEVGARYILTAHTQDDHAETILLGLIRSARLESLRGIPVRRGAILRPMLRVARREVRLHAASRRLEFREDPTNREPRYLRNRIRKELIPLLERRYRPGIAPRLARLACQVGATLERRSAFADHPAGVRGRSDPSSADPHAPQSAPAGGNTPAIRCERRTWTGTVLPDGRTAAVFDAEILQKPVIRVAEPGDRVVPFGMDGRRKLGHVLREAGIPSVLRETYPLVASEAGTIVWVPGIVRSGDAPVGPLTRYVWVFWMDDSHGIEARVAEREPRLQGEPRRVTLEQEYE